MFFLNKCLAGLSRGNLLPIINYQLPIIMSIPIIDKTFTNQDFSGQKLSSTEYDNCIFEQCNFMETDMSVVTFLECRFIGCNFTKVMIKQTAFRDECFFEECKLVGANFASCDDFMFSVKFKGCLLDYSSFYGFEIKNIQFDDCKLNGTDFTEANLTGASFLNSDLSNTIFVNTIAEKVDFTTASNFDIDPARNRLKKAKFSKQGLSGLLRKYDIIVQ
ncbi:pentapeptide repeat-containing protein [Aquimarina sp. RZ0]|nr:pentapeptide repeat-containing protein [Aquimarina sp. RZ0]